MNSNSAWWNDVVKANGNEGGCMKGSVKGSGCGCKNRYIKVYI